MYYGINVRFFYVLLHSEDTWNHVYWKTKVVRMNKLNTIYALLSKFKYVIVIVFGIVFVGFVDSNSLYRMALLSYEAKELRGEIEKYNKVYETDRKQLHDLEVNPLNIKKVARERYFMKADDEDIFVLSSDKNADEDGK